MNSAIRLLVINEIWPSPNHSAGSCNVIMHELIKGLAFEPGFKLGFLKIVKDAKDSQVSGDEQMVLENLKSWDIDVLPILVLPQTKRNKSMWHKILKPCLADFYPEAIHYQLIEKTFQSFAPDLILVILSEQITAWCSEIKIPKFAYYGNPDAKTALARLFFDYKYGNVNILRYLVLKKIIKNFEKVHLKYMKKWDILANVAFNDAQYYQDQGHNNAFYIQNVWIDRFGSSWKEKRRALEQKAPLLIIGSLGNVNATANRYGLNYLADEILPRLENKLKDRVNYEVHIMGPGKMNPYLLNKLQRPEVKIRGYVDDVDQEIFKAAIFLCLNNACLFKVTHTRFLHAWSLGSCVVAHKDSRLSMPEILDGKNALLGESPDEITDKIVKAIFDPALCQKIGEQGYQTFKNYFTAEKVSPKIAQKIREHLKRAEIVPPRNELGSVHA